MACGCPATTDPKANGLICLGCPDRHGLIACSINGQPLVAICAAGSCPAGRHVGADGVCRVYGVRWHGAPAPLRWLVGTRIGRLAMGGVGRNVGRLPGCGCVVRLKGWWMKLIGVFKAKMAPPPPPP